MRNYLNFFHLLMNMETIISRKLATVVILQEEEQKNTDNPLDDNPNFTWDEYGNPEIKD